MKKTATLGVILCFCIIMVMAVSVKRVEALTFDLNCIISGSSCTPSVSFGTVVLTDNGSNVDITVDLVGSGVHKIMSVNLNYDDAFFNSSHNFGTTLGTGNANKGVIENENNWFLI